MKKNNSGEVFDNAVSFFHADEEAKKFIDYYFSDEEIKDKKILDAGTRVGDYALQLVNKGAQFVTGIDLSKKSIDVAERKFATNKKLKFYQGNIRKLSMFHDSEFDIVLCVGTIMYLKPKDMKKAFNELLRVARPRGTILIAFQKNKNYLAQLFTIIANLMPMKIYLGLINILAMTIQPFSPILIGRKAGIDYLKYDVLLSLRGLHYGIPFSIPKKFRIKTASCEYSSEKMTATFKIKLGNNKKLA
ncbi:hypothetical protein A3F29_01830 [Candidatus Roizmanbacteria bacterium RIFCSPHIGHO2_12_FULL_33_9]|uniref:Methyltransferase domain-containing protein n=1 Tax=Candidatus Roizmanbacteria bacterium RIFCSPHIGHO2_12_FULL_33_9 TaxID=1802045 RepID=A0A1F7HFG4_9BACT|nr:MAG: hypothetical protein A3F29_01830 [Candidatus Roizmanbacteria bacterium RIFCSPHIGHO2_12_FULL_33_9]